MVIVLVVMWLVVLVPMFVRRHEDDEAGDADRSASRARVLTRRAPPGRRTRSYRHHPLDDAPVDGRGRPAVAAAAFSRDRVRRRMLRRRRRTLVLLFALAAAGFAAAELMTAWFWVVQVLGTALLIGYVGWLRQQVRRERARRRRRAALAAGRPAPFPAPLTRRPGVGPTRRQARTARPAQAGYRTAGHPVGLAARADESTAAPRLATAADGGSWRPVPVPTPTYVTKPAVHRVDSVVSLDDDDPALIDIDPIVEPVERRRAVNG
jgi:hypothetical protein